MERLASILPRVLIGNRPAVDGCALCGNAALYRDSHIINGQRVHDDCHTAVNVDGVRSMSAGHDIVRVCGKLGEEGVLYLRLEPRLLPYIEKGTADSLCRMITFAIGEIRKDPSIRDIRKNYLVESLGRIRSSYLPALH